MSDDNAEVLVCGIIPFCCECVRLGAVLVVVVVLCRVLYFYLSPLLSFLSSSCRSDSDECGAGWSTSSSLHGDLISRGVVVVLRRKSRPPIPHVGKVWKGPSVKNLNAYVNCDTDGEGFYPEGYSTGCCVFVCVFVCVFWDEGVVHTTR